MTRIVQEKFQVRPEDNRNDDAHSGWIGDKAARTKKNTPGREGRRGGDYDSRYMDNAVGFNSLPPGMDIEAQEMTDQRKFDIVIQSQTDAWPTYPNAEEFKKGYKRKKMLTTDDEYTGAHTDIFYGEITEDGETGFVERGNLLDRM
jgi:hypothetical protein